MQYHFNSVVVHKAIVKMKVVLGLILLCTLVCGDFVHHPLKTGVKFADKDFLLKQKFFFEILRHVHQPTTFSEYLPYADKYVVDEFKYTDFALVQQFFKYFHTEGFFPDRGTPFTVFREDNFLATKYLFDFFYQAKDWDTLYKNIIWARHNVNEYMFIYVVSVLVTHKVELQGIVLPAPYEMYPFYYFNIDVFKQGDKYKLEGKHYKNFKYIVTANYSSDYDFYHYNENFYGEENKLAYFTEDIGYNSYYYWFNVDYPFWMRQDMNLNNDHRGELFLYFHQQLLARYWLERYANGLGDIGYFSWDKPLEYGFYPQMKYYNGYQFPSRPDDYHFNNKYNYQMIETLKLWEQRIINMIDYGYFYMDDGTKVDMTKPEGINYLGNFINGNTDSQNIKFYKYFEFFAKMYLGGNYFGKGLNYDYLPTALEQFDTCLRDPVFYQLYNRIIDYYYQFTSKLPVYTHEELYYEGFKFNDVQVDKLYTYFDYFYSDVSNGIDVDLSKKAFKETEMSKEFFEYKKVFKDNTWDFVFKAKQQRLNYKPFTLSFNINSSKQQKGSVRVFFGPKFELGHDIEYMRKHFVQFDQFVYDFAAGDNFVKRSSKDFAFTVKDRTTYSELYHHVMLAIDGKEKFPLDMSEAHCGFPDRLLLPKGSVGGTPFMFYFIVTPYVPYEITETSFNFDYSCGIGSGYRYIDHLPFGFPFDREIFFFDDFYVKNSFFKDVYVYEIKETEINKTH